MAEHASESAADSVILDSDIVYDLCCDICKDDDDNVEALAFCTNCRDYLCRLCEEAHRRNRLSRDHVMQATDQMPHKKKPPPLPPKVNPRPCTEPCDIHRDKTLEYYCADDSRLGCTICMTVNHRRCRQVDHISDLSKDLLSSKPYRDFIDTVDNLKTKSKTVIDVATENASEAEQLCNNAVTAIKEQRQSVDESFDKFIETNVEAVRSADLRKMKDVTAKVTTVLNEAEKVSTDLQILQADNDLCQLFIRMIKFGDYSGALHEVLSEADANNKITVYTFEPSETIQTIQDNPTSVGHVSVQSVGTRRTSVQQDIVGVVPEGRNCSFNKLQLRPSGTDTIGPSPPRLPVRSRSPAPAAVSMTRSTDPNVSKAAASHQNQRVPPPLPARPHLTLTANRSTAIASQAAGPNDTNAEPIAKIDVTTEGDATSNKCFITGSTLLPGNKLVLADWNNAKLKLVDLQKSIVISTLTTSSNPPWNVATTFEQQIAVTYPKSQTITFAKVSNGLTTIRNLSVEGRCTAILYIEGQLIVGFSDIQEIYIMDLDGIVERKIKRPSAHQWPSAMALSPTYDSIYVVDDIGYCIRRLSAEGAVDAEHRDDTQNEETTDMGVLVDREGRVLVSGGGEAGTVALFTPELRKIRVIAGGLRHPKAMGLCHDTGKLYVGSLSDFVAVYQFQ